MAGIVGHLKVMVVRGKDLAKSDRDSSDPYVVIHSGAHEKAQTTAKLKNLNPEWHEELTLAISDPSIPIKLEVFDYDMFSKDDPIGVAEFVIEELIEVSRLDLADVPDNTLMRTVVKGKHNSLAGLSQVNWKKGKVLQDLVLKLQNVDKGEVVLQLHWVDAHAHHGSTS